MTLHQVGTSPAETTRAGRMGWPVATIATLTAATVAIHLRDPHRSGSWGLCPSAALGVWCPGCGGLRAVHDLTHLRVLDAASSNLLLVVAVPVVLVQLGRWTLDGWTGRVRAPLGRHLDVVLSVVGLVSLAAFTVLRNLPPGSWLAP